MLMFYSAFSAIERASFSFFIFFLFVFVTFVDDLPPTFELVTSYNTTNYTVSDNSLYIIWTGFAPWFGTLTSANLDIRVEEHLILR